MEGLVQDQRQLKEYRLTAGRFRLDQITLNQIKDWNRKIKKFINKERFTSGLKQT
jgi:hypothetical protein